MTVSRYKNNVRINMGSQLGVSDTVSSLRILIKNGVIPISEQIIATGDDRLDALAGSIYGDASLWWVLAAASDVGWGMQVPPGTVINVIKISDLGKVVV